MTREYAESAHSASEVADQSQQVARTLRDAVGPVLPMSYLPKMSTSTVVVNSSELNTKVSAFFLRLRNNNSDGLFIDRLWSFYRPAVGT